MSCELKYLAQCVDLVNVKKCLQNEDTCNSLNNLELPAQPGDNDWLRSCKVAISPCGDVLAIGKKNQIVVLTQKWNSSEESEIKMKFCLTWQGSPCQQSSEEITSVVCLPLIAQGQTHHGGADWTCLAIGFSTGYVRFYTESGNFLTSELFHNEQVLQIKCMSYKMSKSTMSVIPDTNEQIVVVYKTVVCMLPGFNLYQTLRTCRNQLARLGTSSSTSTISLQFKKYGFNDCDSITDGCFVGQTTNNVFDHLVTASLCGGYDSYYRPSPPQSNLIVATGRNPFVGYHYTIEGGGGPVLTDVAKAVASKLKNTVTSAIPVWFGLGSKKPSTAETKQKEHLLEPAEQLGCRFGLCDLWRHGENVVLSPDRRLSAVSDTLGRVLLIENRTGLAVRIWKGYRDAQCGFLEVVEDLAQKSRHRKTRHVDTVTSQPRRVIYLVIYSPKKGVIEVYVTQHGPRVASFITSKNGVLLYTPHGLVGLSSTPSKGGNSSQYPVLFIDGDGGVKEIVVPFHLALSDVNSKKARDLHLLKKLKSFLREEEYNEDELEKVVGKCCVDLKTDDVKLQLVEYLCTNKNITTKVFHTALNVFIDDYRSKDDSQSMFYLIPDPETLDQLGHNLLSLSEQIIKLLNLYELTVELNNIPPSYEAVVNNNKQQTNLQEYKDELLMSEKDIEIFVNFVNLIQSLQNKRKQKKLTKICFNEIQTADLVQFLSCFNFDQFTSSNGKQLNFKMNLNEERLRNVGELLFHSLLTNNISNDWRHNVMLSNINCGCLMNCLLQYWLYKKQDTNLFYELLNLIDILKIVCSIEDYNVIISDDTNTPSPWWSQVRLILEQSKYSLQALAAAVSCRAVTIYIEQKYELEKVGEKAKKKKKAVGESGETSEGTSVKGTRADTWETVSQDTCQWDILIVQLEDLSLLNTVLSLKFDNCTPGDLTCLPYEHELVSLKNLVNKGKGSVSELVSKWLTQFAVSPCVLVCNEDVEFDLSSDTRLKTSSSANRLVNASDGLPVVLDDADEIKPEDELSLFVSEHMQVLKKRFPYSLTSSVLLANLCWEYLIHWYKNVEQTQVLQSAVECLKIIPSLHVRRGTAHLAWTTHIKQVFETVSKLINKVGKVPKEKLCKQECNMSNIQVSELFKITTELLNIFLETNNTDYITVAYDFNKCEDVLWFNDKLNKNSPSLVQLSLIQNNVNEELIFVHLKLSYVMLMVSSLNIKVHRPISTLFDTVSQCELFSDLTNLTQLQTPHVDSKLKFSRLQFLYKAISKSVETIQIIEDLPHHSVPERTKLDTSECNRWIRLIFELGTMWNITLDDLRRHQACELYSTGYDRLAEEVVSTVSDRTTLASQLLVVCGQRLLVLIHSSNNLGERLSNLAPALSTWLDTLSIETLKCHTSTLSDVTVMLSYILQWLPETHPDLQLAILVADAIQGLEN